MNNKEIMKKIGELEQQIAELKEAAQKQDESKVWRPKENEEYWYCDSNISAFCDIFNCVEVDTKRFDIGNCFPTKEHAERVAKEFRMLLKLWQYHDMFCPDYVPDWEDGDEFKYFVYYTTYEKLWAIDSRVYSKEPTQVYFDSKETARKVCDLLNGEEEEK